jgi:hypothetical protein
MTPFSKLTGRGKLIEVLRWLCVCPAAVLAETVVGYLVGAVTLIVTGGWGIPGDSNFVHCLRLFLYYVQPKSIFVIAGVKTAPRQPMATAIVLSVIGILLSLVKHVVGQHLAGNNVRIVNYTHLVAESTGTLCGAALILLHVRRDRRTRGESC